MLYSFDALFPGGGGGGYVIDSMLKMLVEGSGTAHTLAD